MTALRRRPTGEDGLSLSELLVTMVVGSLVLGAAAVLFSSALQSSTTTQRRLDTVNSGRIAMDALTRSLRTAVLPSQLDDLTNTDAAFLRATADSVSFYANLQNDPGPTPSPDDLAHLGPRRVSYAVVGGSLVQSLQLPDAHAVDDHDYTYCDPQAAGCSVTRLALSPVSTVMPLFTYYANGGTRLDLDPACGCLSSAGLLAVDAVEVRLAVPQPAGSAAAPTTYLSRVALPNHDALPKPPEAL